MNITTEQEFLSSHSHRNDLLAASRLSHKSTLKEERDKFWLVFRSSSQSHRRLLEEFRTKSPSTFVTAEQRRNSCEIISQPFQNLESLYFRNVNIFPAGDVRLIQEELSFLKKEVEFVRDTVICPRGKFVFRRYHSWVRSRNHDTVPSPEVPEIVEDEREDDFNSVVEKEQEEIGVERLENLFEEEAILQDNNDNDTLTIKNLIDCNVSIHKSFKSIHIDLLQNTTLNVHCPVTTSVFIYHCTNSTIIASARQFRIHDSNDTNFHIQTKSGPIIENCNGLIFWGDYYKMSATVAPPGGDNGEWRNVKDFKWLSVYTKSPHYTIMEDGHDNNDSSGNENHTNEVNTIDCVCETPEEPKLDREDEL